MSMFFKIVNCMLCRTIMALWKARSLTPEEKIQLVEEESETKDLQNEEGGSFLGIEDVKMSEVFSSTIPFDVRFPYLVLTMMYSPLCDVQQVKQLQFWIESNFHVSSRCQYSWAYLRVVLWSVELWRKSAVWTTL